MILLNFLYSLFPLLLFTLNQNANGLYVPRIYGHVDPQKCLFIAETGEKHQIFKVDNIYMFGRVYLLDAENANLLKANGKCNQMEKLKRLENSDSSANQIVFKHTRVNHTSEQALLRTATTTLRHRLRLRRSLNLRVVVAPCVQNVESAKISLFLNQTELL